MPERRDKEINGKTYSLLLPPPSVCMKLCNKTVAVVAPILGGLGGQVQTGGLDAAQIFQLFSIFLRGVNPEAVDEIFLRGVEISKLSCNGKVLSNKAEFEQHFDENRKDLYPACIWALWECVHDFLPDFNLSELVSRMENLKKLASQFQKDGQQITGSEGQSGEGSAPGETLLTEA